MKKIIIKICFFIPLLVFIITPIVWVDPLHLFGRTHGLNTEYFYNQRLIKTNILRYETPDYNSIIIGSSRIRYMSDIEIGNYKILNLGMDGLKLVDFPGFIDLANERVPDSLECIIVAMDMFGTRKPDSTRTYWGSTDEYLSNSQDISYLLPIMIGPNSFKYSTKSIANYILHGKKAATSWKKLNLPVPPPKSVHARRIRNAFSTWEFDENSLTALEYIKTTFKNQRLIFIVNPVSVELFKLIDDQNRTSDFLIWLHTLAQTLDGFYNFMDITPLTSTPQNWRDVNHAHPDTMKLQIESIVLNKTDNPNFTFITRENADSVISCIGNRLKEYNFPQYRINYENDKPCPLIKK